MAFLLARCFFNGGGRNNVIPPPSASTDCSSGDKARFNSSCSFAASCVKSGFSRSSTNEMQMRPKMDCRPVVANAKNHISIFKRSGSIGALPSAWWSYWRILLTRIRITTKSIPISWVACVVILGIALSSVFFVFPNQSAEDSQIDFSHPAKMTWPNSRDTEPYDVFYKYATEDVGKLIWSIGSSSREANELIALGQVRSRRFPSICLLWKSPKTAGLVIGGAPCSNNGLAPQQAFVLDGPKGQLRPMDQSQLCVSRDLIFRDCSDVLMTSHFVFSPERRIIWQSKTMTKCLSVYDVSPEHQAIGFLQCNETTQGQLWDWQLLFKGESAKGEFSRRREAVELLWGANMKNLDCTGSRAFGNNFDIGSRGWINSLAVVEGERPTRMHGMVGRWKNGTQWWKPKPTPLPLDHPEVNATTELWNGDGYYLNLTWALPLDRDAPDGRDDVCLDVAYNYDSLSAEVDASIVIVFKNEPLPNLLRTVHSVLNRTPPPLLREIILVNDGSTIPEVQKGGQLDEAVTLLPKVKVIHMETNVGIVKARMAGICQAQAPVFVILDSHVEVPQVWLEPMLDRIRQSPRTLTMPQIDTITADKFLFANTEGIGCWLSFGWHLRERGLLTGSSATTAPMSSPCTAGGLFAMRKDWFWELGGYDEAMTGWGAENIELPFRIWMCGGSVECPVCSRAYHLYREGSKGYPARSAPLWINKMRAAAVWMDEWAEITRQVIARDRPDENVTIGNVDKILEIKRVKKCHGFKWFLDQVDPTNWLRNISNLVAVTEVRNKVWTNVCIDPMRSERKGQKWGANICDETLSRQILLFVRIPGYKHIIIHTIFEYYCLLGTMLSVDCRLTGQTGNFDFGSDGQITWTDPKTAETTCMGLIKANGTEMVEAAFLRCNTSDRTQYWSWQPYVPNPPDWLTAITSHNSSTQAK